MGLVIHGCDVTMDLWRKTLKVHGFDGVMIKGFDDKMLLTGKAMSGQHKARMDGLLRPKSILLGKNL